MKRIIQIAFFALFAWLASGVALAQDAPKKDGEGWEAVNGDMLQPGESIPAARLVGGAYGFICAAVVVWVASVARRARRLEDEVDELKKKLAAARG
ncbi:MAG TPA: hypothetical protein VHB97_24375 [Polyangia bacterium]|jgi:hypothetical protein|nr:hypothetical protein [Polyangia bacterium]